MIVQWVRALGGAALLAGALGGMFLGVRSLSTHDYLGGGVLMLGSVALANAALELLRPVTGE